MKYEQAKADAAARIQFDEKQHRYTLDGMWLPGVTSVIEPIDNTWRFVPKDIKEAALYRGTFVHMLTEVADTKGVTSELLDIASAAGFLGYLEAWLTFKRNITILETEQRVYHHVHRYAGTLDRVANVSGYPLAPSLIEIKTGGIVPTYRLQTAAYQLAYNDGSLHGTENIQFRFLVVLKADGTYVVEEHKDRADIEYFLAAKKMAEWRAKYG
jgi:hypothetical protein